MIRSWVRFLIFISSSTEAAAAGGALWVSNNTLFARELSAHLAQDVLTLTTAV